MAIAYNKRTHNNNELRSEHAGQTVILTGWVRSYRDHGGMVFIDLRDRAGITQIKFNPETDPEAHALARTLRNEDCIAIEGRVALRGENINPKHLTGEIEVEGRAVDLLSKSDPPPFEIDDGVKANEELRLQYRFLDLRRPSMQRVMRMRHNISKAVRDYFHDNGFLEIETPVLTKSTPEGARDYLVPSRIQPGRFFALPQSPQLFKQLFMVAGFDRYAQIVRCFRDEDLRADRQPEFTQIDMEMSFVQAEDVMTAVEGCVAAMFRAALGMEIPQPFSRITFTDAMDRFGIDRPDTRFGLELKDITEVVRQTDFKVFGNAIEAGGVVKCFVVTEADGAGKLTRKITDGLTEELKGIGAGGMPVTKVVSGPSGPEFSTGVAKFLQPMCGALCAAADAAPGDALFFSAGPYAEVCKFLHYARTRMIELLELKPSGQWHPLWVVDFPMFQWDDEEHRYFSTHHPFTSPRDEDIALLDTDPGKVRAKAYDLVLNGTEMAGGSIRIHRRDVQRKVFGLLGISEQEAKEKFQFLLEALRFGPPPHGGIAFGLDRWVMLLAGRDSLRDVIAYPKTQRAVCPLTEAPGTVAEEQLVELGIDLRAEVRAKLAEQAAPATQHVHRAHDEQE